MNFNSADSFNSPRSTFLAALCVFGFSCSSPVNDAMDALSVISPGCGPILSDMKIPIDIAVLPDQSTSYFSESRRSHYQKCRVVFSSDKLDMKVDYYTERTGQGVSDSCIVKIDSVACNGSEPVDDEEVILFGKTISSLVKGWLKLPRATSSATATSTDMPAAVGSSSGM